MHCARIRARRALPDEITRNWARPADAESAQSQTDANRPTPASKRARDAPGDRPGTSREPTMPEPPLPPKLEPGEESESWEDLREVTLLGHSECKC